MTLPHTHRGPFAERRLTFPAVHFLLAMLLCGSSFAQETVVEIPTENRFKKEFALETTLDRQFKGVLFKPFNLGPLLPGAEVTCAIKVKNASERLVKISRLTVSCSCLTVTPQASELLPDSELSFLAKWVVPTQSTAIKADRHETFIAFDDVVFQFGITLNYQLAGMIGFSANSLTIELPQRTESREVIVPYFAEKTIPNEYIDIELSKSMAKVDWKVDYVAQTIVLQVPGTITDNGTVLGNIKIRNIESQISDGIVVVIEKQADISVYPSLIQFRIKPNDPTKYVARIMLVDNQGKGNAPPFTEFFIAGNPINATQVSFRSGVCQYSLFIDAAKPLPSAKEINLVVTVADQRLALKHPFVIASSDTIFSPSPTDPGNQ